MKKINLIILLLILLSSCNLKNSKKNSISDADQHKFTKGDTLCVLTLYSSTTYFNYRGQEMGFEYELIRKISDALGLNLKVIVAQNSQQLIEKLKNGEGDLIAYNIAISNDLKKEVFFCGRELITHQVLVQRKRRNQKILDNVTQLIGKEISVEYDSKYYERLKNLNEELGGGINIRPFESDSITTEGLIGKVAKGEIPYTLADDDIAKLNKTYYNNIDISLEVSFPQRSSWVTLSADLAQKINDWFSNSIHNTEYKAINKKYFENSKIRIAAPVLSMAKGQISNYDHLFKRYAKDIDWDWRIIAAQAYQESNFDVNAESWAGAVGLMQLVPNTARAFGLSPSDYKDPEANIKAATLYIISLNKAFSKIEDFHERLKFILAAYNSGLGHILDAMALADKYGKDPLKWNNNVANYVLLKSNPEYYNDPVCKNGYFRGVETTEYVGNVLALYAEYKKKIKM